MSARAAVHVAILIAVALATVGFAWCVLPGWFERLVVLAGELGVAGFCVVTLAGRRRP